MANTSYIGVGPADRDPTVSDNSVTTGKIADNAVTGAKIGLTGNVQGNVMYYNGTDWVVLAPGTSGEALKTQGAGANVVWGAVSSTGDFANGGDTATANRTLGNNDAYALGFETNAVDRLSISATGFVNNTLGMVGNPASISQNVTTASNTNAASAGPMTIDTGVTVELGTNSTWTIV